MADTATASRPAFVLPPRRSGEGRVRHFRPDDIPALVSIRPRVFRFTERPDPKSLARYFEEVFFENPWVDPALPSFIYEDRTGRPVGFLGVLPRRMVYRGEPLRTAVATQLMVAPGIHGLAALRLAHAFLVGRQDLSLSDTANDAARRLWEAVGGSTSYVHSLQWHFALRPVGAATSADAGSRVMRLAARGLRRLWDLADFAITAVSKSDHRRPPPGEAVVVSPKVLVPHVPEVLSWCPLRPVYEDGSLEWLWGKAGEKRALGTLRACLVRESAGEVVGWFVYYARGSGESAVAQIAYRKPHLPLVMDHLFHDAWRTGATGLTGRLEPGLIPDLTRRGATFHRSGPWTLYHSDRLEIIKAIDQGNALLSRLEGEWWLSF